MTPTVALVHVILQSWWTLFMSNLLGMGGAVRSSAFLAWRTDTSSNDCANTHGTRMETKRRRLPSHINPPLSSFVKKRRIAYFFPTPFSHRNGSTTWPPASVWFLQLDVEKDAPASIA
eukprot:CAMPEP_0172580946 /NCGR_PEP_ID=MMETSP1067-20121228/140020_1 /TAXON_ID=265564 ORGANISM="Thalassiosira punctigera, Strain Tpunct2005C2" /NCGR_SAMPLE_ID=MMETSP1067 /ASSEMBLY_ACC=CAM_ASM_000444 /LENGTH=117 /DNA_ID=CAMNT_0013373701 /DNA_START=472 /DNA_END=824 /DNA_ORIENTATION=+